MSGLPLEGSVRQENLNVRGTVWSRSDLRERGKGRSKTLDPHASAWSEDGSCSEEEDGLELAGSRAAWGSRASGAGGRESKSSGTHDSAEEEEDGGRVGEGESLQGEREERNVELLVYTELTSIRDKLREQLHLLAEEEDEVQTRARDVTERERSLREREEALKQTEEVLRHREEMLADKEEEVVRREAAVVEREGALGCREQKVLEMERLAREVHESLACCAEEEMSARVEEVERGQREEVGRLQRCLKEKGREVQRLKQLCDAMRQASGSLKSQLQEAKEKSSKLESQVSSTTSRLAGLQRRNEQLASRLQQLQAMSESPVSGMESGPLPVRETKRRGSGLALLTSQPRDPVYMYSDLLGSVMEWLCRVHLSQPLPPAQLAGVQRSSSKVLPSVASLLPLVPSHSDGLQLPVLQFVFWCVLHLSAKQQKSTLTSTLRRIGEAVLRPVVVCADSEEGGQQKVVAARAFFRSSDCHIRTLSCLLILQTLTQVDCLAQVFEQLKQDLKEDRVREVFLVYRGVQVVLPFMKTANRVLCTHAVDTYLLLSVESAVLPHFLAACGIEQWFSACTALLREARHTDTATLEKISILLQRLSKIKDNRHLFESHQLVGVVEEVLQSQAGCLSPFLSLNLHSTLLNLSHRH